MGTSFSIGSIAAQASAMQSTQDRTIQQVRVANAPDQNGKIEKGAKEFEAMLLGTWLQQAEQSFATVPGADGEDEDNGGKDQMMSLGVQQLATSLANSGGIGIASMVAKAMHAAAEKADNQTVQQQAVAGDSQVVEKP